MLAQKKAIALVTGTASGMGKAVAHRYLSEGWLVIGVDLTEQESFDGFIAVKANITDLDNLSTSVINALDGRKISTVVNAAGIFPVSSLASFSSDLYRRIFDINVLGTLNVAKVGQECMTKEGGSMVFFASVDAFAVSQNQLLYSASKAAVVSLTKSLAIELVEAGIVVNTIAPGWVETEGTLAGGRLEEGVKAVPLKRAAKVEEISDWVWKLGEKPGYMTGETLIISGGVYMR